MRITPPNYTQTPNDLFDYWLPHLNESELKVLLVIIRKTFGWHKHKDVISISQLEKITGLSRRSITKASETLQLKGVIKREIVGVLGSEETFYQLIVQENTDIKSPPPSVLNTPPPSVLSTDTKESAKEKESASAFKDLAPPSDVQEKQPEDEKTQALLKSCEQENINIKPEEIKRWIKYYGLAYTGRTIAKCFMERKLLSRSNQTAFVQNALSEDYFGYKKEKDTV